MAVRDKSQKVGFSTTNIYELYKKAQGAAEAQKADAPSLKSDARVWRAEDLDGIKIAKFQPRTLTPATPVAAVNPAPAQARGGSPFDDLKGNLEKLQDLHSKLRFMLKELEDLVNKK